jgi:predicted porin
MNIFAKYKMDNLTVHVAHRDVENNNGGSAATDDNKYTVYGASYAMGANTFAVAVADSDDGQDGDYTLSAKHALSKRTSVYLTIFEDDSADQETTLVGVKHTF